MDKSSAMLDFSSMAEDKNKVGNCQPRKVVHNAEDSLRHGSEKHRIKDFQANANQPKENSDRVGSLWLNRMPD